jgi:hypothetical protein
LILPIGHYVGASHRLGEAGVAHQVRRGATFHDLTDEQFAVWAAAHGTPDAVRDDVTWRRQAVEEHPQVTGLADAGEMIDELIKLGLLVEVTPGSDRALEFARSHRLVPLMLGLGNSSAQPDIFGIGFLNQPVLEVSFGIYDLWQWSTMDDSLWTTCANAADVARRGGTEDPDSVDPARLLTGFLPSLHALLVPNAAYLDAYFRLQWPQGASSGAGTASSTVGAAGDV